MVIKNSCKQFLLIVLALILNIETFGWGQTGHRVVGQIAEEHLTKRAKKNLQKLMGHESLAIASTWMDEVKSNPKYDHTHDWHWVTLPEDMKYEETEKNPNGDIIMTLERLIFELKNNELTDSLKREHIRMLVHLIGDIHQPLHVGKGSDRGGNDVKVKWFGQTSNLHRVWDTDMINSQLLSYTEYAQALNSATKDQIKSWQNSNVRDWAYESAAVRAQVYDFDNIDRMGFDYAYQQKKLLDKRLLQAGIRLAGVLNQIFGR